MEKKQIISIICPAFNEEENISEFCSRLHCILSKIPLIPEVIFIDDGSTDNTLKELLHHQKSTSYISVISLTRNFGKEAALTAGLDHACGDIIIPIDADLQDPPELIEQLIVKWQEGYDMVLAKRINRDTDTHFKKWSAESFYWLHNRLSHTSIPPNCGDFRLMTREVVDSLKQLPENQRFMKGMFAWLGFKTTEVGYIREKRTQGKTKFNPWRLWNLALEGITSFSTAPLRIWLYIGIFVALFSFVYGSIILIKTLVFGIDVPGYASTLTSILFLGGLQLISIGVLGEYIGRVYLEVKRRPNYLIRNMTKPHND